MRLVSALEDLAAQEAATLQARDFVEVIAIQNRAAPLVQLLASHAMDFRDDLRLRIAALINRRNESDAWLAAEIEIVRLKLRDTAETQRRVTQVSPAYGRSIATFRRLSVTG